MTCTSTCRKPNGRQAHCGACHLTWAGVTGFDEHRRGGICRTPAETGHQADSHGVYRAPVTDADRKRLAAIRRRNTDAHSADANEPQGCETGPGVPASTPDGPKPAETLSGGWGDHPLSETYPGSGIYE